MPLKRLGHPAILREISQLKHTRSASEPKPASPQKPKRKPKAAKADHISAKFFSRENMPSVERIWGVRDDMDLYQAKTRKAIKDDVCIQRDHLVELQLAALVFERAEDLDRVRDHRAVQRLLDHQLNFNNTTQAINVAKTGPIRRFCNRYRAQRSVSLDECYRQSRANKGPTGLSPKVWDRIKRATKDAFEDLSRVHDDMQGLTRQNHRALDAFCDEANACLGVMEIG